MLVSGRVTRNRIGLEPLKNRPKTATIEPVRTANRSDYNENSEDPMKPLAKTILWNRKPLGFKSIFFPFLLIIFIINLSIFLLTIFSFDLANILKMIDKQ